MPETVQKITAQTQRNIYTYNHKTIMEFKISIKSLDPSNNKSLDMIVVDEDLSSILSENTAELIRIHFGVK
jgi:hypothetical protein